MQQLELSMKGVATFLGMLRMHRALGDLGTWKKIQENVCLAEEAVCNEVLKKNQDKAIEVEKANGSTTDAGGRVSLSCSTDGGWQKRSSTAKFALSSLPMPMPLTPRSPLLHVNLILTPTVKSPRLTFSAFLVLSATGEVLCHGSRLQRKLVRRLLHSVDYRSGQMVGNKIMLVGC